MGRRIVVLLVLGWLPALMLPAFASASPLHGADLSISLTASPESAVGGSNVSFTATVTNNSNDDADDVEVTDQLPAGATFVPGKSDPSCAQAQASDPVVCDLDELEEYASVDVVITATIPCIADTLLDSATVTGEDPDPNPSNNSAETSVAAETPCSGASGEVEDGGTVTTDPNHQGTQPDLGIYETAGITVPKGISGEVSIQLSTDGLQSDCPGFSSLIATTDQPTTTEEHRLVISFVYAACSIPPGTNIQDTTISKSVDGQTYVDVPACVTYETPDPCVKWKKVRPNGDFCYRVLWTGQGDPSWRPR